MNLFLTILSMKEKITEMFTKILFKIFYKEFFKIKVKSMFLLMVKQAQAKLIQWYFSFIKVRITKTINR
jgi:hypothetical protein